MEKENICQKNKYGLYKILGNTKEEEVEKYSFEIFDTKK